MTEHVKRAGFFIGALICFAIGILILPTPFPIGIVFWVLGIALLVMSSTTVRNWFHDLRLRNGWIDDRLRDVEGHLPEEMREALTPDQDNEAGIDPGSRPPSG